MSQNSIEQAVKDRHIYMTTTPIRKLIVRLAIPTIISMLVTGLYSMADTFFVGRISTNATAAVGIVFSLMSMIQAIGFFCGQGSGTFVSRRLGAGDIREANEMAATGFFLAFGLGLIVSVIGQLMVRPLALLLGATVEGRFLSFRGQFLGSCGTVLRGLLCNLQEPSPQES